MQFYLEIITGDPSIYTMDHLKFIVLNQKEESISVIRVKCKLCMVDLDRILHKGSLQSAKFAKINI